MVGDSLPVQPPGGAALSRPASPLSAAMAAPSTGAVLLNFVSFQAGWFACVWLAARHHAGLAILAVAVVVIVRLAGSARPLRTGLLLAWVTLIGLAWDSAVMASGAQDYVSGAWLPGLAPTWIIAMWTLFGTLLGVSLRWLRGRPWLAAGFGLLGGPLAYAGGARLGAVTLHHPLLAAALEAAGWAALTPLLVRLGERLDG